jgi:hypothetical protein
MGLAATATAQPQAESSDPSKSPAIHFDPAVDLIPRVWTSTHKYAEFGSIGRLFCRRRKLSPDCGDIA